MYQIFFALLLEPEIESNLETRQQAVGGFGQQRVLYLSTLTGTLSPHNVPKPVCSEDRPRCAESAHQGCRLAGKAGPQIERVSSMPEHHNVLTVAEVAVELRCSKAHVYNVINGTVCGVTPLPVIAIGRRKLVRWDTLECWKNANERLLADAMMAASPEVDAVGA